MPGSSAFAVEVLRAEDAARVVLRGELDLATAPQLESILDALAAEPVPAVLVDLRELRFMDSTGLRLLIQADARARRDSRALTIIRAPGRIARLFALAGVDERLELSDEPPPGAP